MRVLVAEADTLIDEGDRARLSQGLAEMGNLMLLRPLPGENLAAAVARLDPDVILVDMARPDRDSLEDIRQVWTATPRPIVLFVDEDDPDFMYSAIAAGVGSYNVVGAALPDVKPIVRTAIALFQRYRQVETDLRAAEKALGDRAAIDRAKALLMRERKLSEAEAYRWLRSRAMDRGRRIADIAQALLDQQKPGAPELASDDALAAARSRKP